MAATSEEQITATETYFSYCDSYEVQGDKILLHVKACFTPNWVGIVQERFFDFERNHLILNTPPLPIVGQLLSGRSVFDWIRS